MTLKSLFIILFFLLVSFLFWGQSSSLPPKDIAIVYIATGQKYLSFWDNFYQNMEKYFIPNLHKHYFIFTDDLDKEFPQKSTRIYQPQLPWPGPTIKRFHYFLSQKDELLKYKYICFLNSNMLPLRTIDKTILPSEKEKMTFVQHPGFYRNFNTKSFTYDRNPKSTAYIPYEEKDGGGGGKYYLMGGFYCGLAKDFIKMSDELKKRIDQDEQNKITAIWHDESHLNRFVIDLFLRGEKPKILTPQYAVPEESLNTSRYSNLKKFKKNPYMIILDKSKRGGHKSFRK